MNSIRSGGWRVGAEIERFVAVFACYTGMLFVLVFSIPALRFYPRRVVFTIGFSRRVCHSKYLYVVMVVVVLVVMVVFVVVLVVKVVFVVVLVVMVVFVVVVMVVVVVVLVVMLHGGSGCVCVCGCVHGNCVCVCMCVCVCVLCVLYRLWRRYMSHASSIYN